MRINIKSDELNGTDKICNTSSSRLPTLTVEWWCESINLELIERVSNSMIRSIVRSYHNRSLIWVNDVPLRKKL